MACGWNIWVWLECIGVVSGCCCKEVFRYPHNNYYFPLLHLYYAPINVRPHPPHPGQGGEFSLFGMAGLPQGSGY